MDSDHPPPTSGGASEGRQSPSSGEMILRNLVEMLLQESAMKSATNSNAAPTGKGQAPNFEDDRDVPSVDEHIQAAGAEAFNKFQRSVNALDKELRNFANAARQLGSSVAILASGFHLRERLTQLLYLYRENAADLFPRKISHVAKDTWNINAPILSGSRRKRGRARKVLRGKAPHLHIPRPTVMENLDAEDFPDQLENLAKDVKTFLNCLNEFPEFTDEGVNASILSFEGDLKYWASCLREYSGQFKYAAVQRYIHELSHEIGDHLDTITSSLCMFIEVGVPTIRFAQKHGSSNLLNLSTIATFFSAVTATTMQFSIELEEKSVTSEAVNCFWFSSLVFSIAAAVNSLLGLTWKQAMYRSPGHRVPWWVLIWIKRSPLVFLVLSVACFSIGLCLFAYASGQDKVTSTVTTVMTAFTSFGLAAVSAWFASERWAFARHRGQKWLSDVLKESVDEFIRLPGINWIYKACKVLSRNLMKFRKMLVELAATIKDIWRSCICIRRRGGEDGEDGGISDLEANGFSTKKGFFGRSATIPASDVSRLGSRDDGGGLGYEPKPARDLPDSDDRDSIVTSIVEAEELAWPPTPVNSPTSLRSSSERPFSGLSNPTSPSPLAAGGVVNPPEPTISTTGTAPSAVNSPLPPAGATQGRQLWKKARLAVMYHQQQHQSGLAPSQTGDSPMHAEGSSGPSSGNLNSPSHPPGSMRFPMRRRTNSSNMTDHPQGFDATNNNSGGGRGAQKRSTLPEPMAQAKSRIASLVPKLATLEATQDLPAHAALVRHLQFSPDGKYLATSSWDRTSVIFKVGKPCKEHKVLNHHQGFIGQVAWSPTGNILLTKLPRGIKIWVSDAIRPGSNRQQISTTPIDRNVAVEALTWMPDGESFLSVEESTVSKISLQGRVLEQYDFGRIKLHDVAVTPDSLRLVGVGPLLESPTGLQPSKSRAEKRLVVFNLETKQVESQIPVLNDVRDITISRNAKGDWIALISYENKAPPQLWKIELVKDRENSTSTARLTLRHTYMPKMPVDFAGPSYFGGKNNELVLCPGKAGDIHIWDQESGALLHLIRGQAHGGDMTCLAWNHASDDPFMFASGSHDGGVRIWTTLVNDETGHNQPLSILSPPYAGTHDRLGPMRRGSHGLSAPSGSRMGHRSDIHLARTESPMGMANDAEDAVSITSVHGEGIGLKNHLHSARALSGSSSGSSMD